MEWKILAGLRFFLAWIVFCCHLLWFVPDQKIIFRFTQFGGLSAVIGFLLISGYSIANSIGRQPKGFYKRRILRIYPLYFCCILVSLIPFLLLDSPIAILNLSFHQPSVWDVIGHLTFMQGFLVGHLPSNGILWTISVEIFCYLLAPIFNRMSTKALLGLQKC